MKVQKEENSAVKAYESIITVGFIFVMKFLISQKQINIQHESCNEQTSSPWNQTLDCSCLRYILHPSPSAAASV